MISPSSRPRGARPAPVVWWLAAGVGLLAIGIAAARYQRFRCLDQSRLKLIEDFNDGDRRNLVGGAWSASASGGSTIDCRAAKGALKGPRRSVGAIAVRLAPQGHARWTTDLNDLDISAATHVSFWIRSNAQMAPLSLELADNRQHAATLALTGSRAPAWHWKRVRIPLREFPGIDCNGLKRFGLAWSAQRWPLAATVMLDDIVFEGPSELFFLSLRDNLYGFPAAVHADGGRIAALPDAAMLQTIAHDTWGYFRDITDRHHHLVLNAIQFSPQPQLGDYTSPTDVGLYLMSVISAADFQFITRAEALERVQATVTQLASLAMWRHLFYNYYNTTNLQVTRAYVSSVDNAWLGAALVVARRTFPELYAACSSLLDRMDFGVFYDPQLAQMRLGFDAETGQFAPYHYGLVVSEARVLSLLAIGKGDVPADHWFRIYRTLPKEWTWQRQVPEGTFRQYRGHDVFQGHYVHNGTPFVPSWGGSLFEFLMPTLVVQERELAPHGLGLNDQRAVEMHRRFALEERGYPVWGLSPSSTPEPLGGYGEFGVAELGAKGYDDKGVVTPHGSILALEFAPADVLENIRQLLRRYPIYGPYGFYDAVDVKTGRVADRYLALDQGMILVAINNYLNGGIMRRRFHEDPIGKRIEWLLQEEQFF